MASRRINFAMAPAMLKNLDKLALKIGLDRTNAIRYCIARTCEIELAVASKEESRK